MTNKEAMQVFKEYIYDIGMADGKCITDVKVFKEALDMAIKALEQEPKIIRCKDCKQFRRWVDTDITFCDLTESPVFETDFCSRAESEDKCR